MGFVKATSYVVNNVKQHLSIVSKDLYVVHYVNKIKHSHGVNWSICQKVPIETNVANELGGGTKCMGGEALLLRSNNIELEVVDPPTLDAQVQLQRSMTKAFAMDDSLQQVCHET
jgi:hypothetical protein